MEPAPKPPDETNPKDLLGVLKPQMNLVPPLLHIRVAKVMELGAKKYGPFNWRAKRVRLTIYIAAMQRHLAALLDGQLLDKESGQPHLAHVAACCGILLDADVLGKLENDLPLPGKAAEVLAQLTEKAS